MWGEVEGCHRLGDHASKGSEGRALLVLCDSPGRGETGAGGGVCEDIKAGKPGLAGELRGGAGL